MKLIKIITYLLCVFLNNMQVKGLAYGVCGVRDRLVGDTIVHVEDCCFNFYKKNEVCVECPPGHSSKGRKCEKCRDGLYGMKCADPCNCNDKERQDRADTSSLRRKSTCTGCRARTLKIKGNFKQMNLSTNRGLQSLNGYDDVVTYMTCVAVGSVLVVVCGLLVKNREAICRGNGSITAMKNEITKRKRHHFGPGKNSGKDKKESLYAEINEKYMVNFDGE